MENNCDLSGWTSSDEEVPNETPSGVAITPPPAKRFKNMRYVVYSKSEAKCLGLFLYTVPITSDATFLNLKPFKMSIMMKQVMMLIATRGVIRFFRVVPPPQI